MANDSLASFIYNPKTISYFYTSAITLNPAFKLKFSVTAQNLCLSPLKLILTLFPGKAGASLKRLVIRIGNTRQSF
jgi:hypothetical protein